MQIGDAIGLGALIVLGLAVSRGVQRRSDLLLTLSDIVIGVGVEFETLATNLWSRQVRGLPWWDRAETKPSRLLRLVDAIVNRLFSVGWALERVALGRNYAFADGRAFGLSAASNYATGSHADYNDEEFYGYYGSDIDDPEDEYDWDDLS